MRDYEIVADVTITVRTVIKAATEEEARKLATQEFLALDYPGDNPEAEIVHAEEA